MKVVLLTHRLHSAGDAWPPPAGALDSRQRPEAEGAPGLSCRSCEDREKPARLLRIPRRALGPSAYMKPDRERGILPAAVHFSHSSSRESVELTS
jgi:hypothetical protein